jgi:predicted aminopeptidase
MRALAFLTAALLTGCSSAGYLVESGIGQWKLFNRARPMEEVLASPLTSDSVRHGLLMVKRAKAFAVNDLGLKATRSYETYVALDAPCVSWAVSASHPLELIEKKWSFPIVGEVPYIGFFSKEGADREARRIEESDRPKPDTWVRCVPAFSSLGWFPDPLYSSMINGKDHHIVEVVVHESLHATVWVRGSVDFNEKLANFVGLEGSVRYMRKERGDAGAALVREEVGREKLFAGFMKDAVARYKATVRNPEDKQAFYRNLGSAYEALARERRFPEPESTAFAKKLAAWNNAALLAYANYYSDYSVLEMMLEKCGGELGRFVAWIAAIQARGESGFRNSPESFLAKVVVTESCP